MNGRAIAVACILLGGCGSTAPRAPVPEAPAAGSEFAPRTTVQLVHGDGASPARPTHALLSLGVADDAELARVGDEVIHKSQVFDRLAENDPAMAQTLIDTCVLDSVVAAAVDRFHIDVTDAEIDARAALEETTLRLAAGDNLDDVGFAKLVRERFGATVAGYRQALRREVGRVLLRSYVIRYLALREDRAEVRVIVHHDASLLAELADRVQRGADFANLARRYSEDASAADGGVLPPLPRSARHPIAQAAFELSPGECSKPLPIDDRGRHALIWCLERQVGRDVAFAEVRAEIVAALDTRPITPFEQNAFVSRFCRTAAANTSTESLDSVQPGR